MWTKEPPTEPGWYWWRRHSKTPDVVELKKSHLVMKMTWRGDVWYADDMQGEWWPDRIQEPVSLGLAPEETK